MKKTTKSLKLNLFLLFCILSQNIFSQENTAMNDYTLNKVVPSEFESIFKDEKNKNDFKKLRDFLNEKEIQKNSIMSLQYDNYVPEKEIEINNRKIKILSKIIEKEADSKLVEIDESNYSYGNKYDVPLIKKYTVREVKEKIEALIEIKDEFKKKSDRLNQQKISIENIMQDIRNCQNQIDTALDPENRKQLFKTTMSSYFVILIGILLVAFFYIVYKKSDHSLSKDLLSGYGLQFITLFVLIIAIILFGILDILKGSELAAMLSGISGYILGKGIQEKKPLPDSTSTTTITPTTTIPDVITSELVVSDSEIPKSTTTETNITNSDTPE